MDSNVTPELAQRVLDADTRNVIKAVGDGGTLPAPHRKLMESIARSPEEAKQARAAALLQKWVEGRDLTDAQRDELHEVYPQIVPKAAPALESSDSAPTPDLDPDGPRIVGPKVVYPKQLAFYATVYGLDAKNGVRTLKRWIAVGKAATPMDLPPLHCPEKMPAWYDLRMSQRCPDNVLIAARDASVEAAPIVPAERPDLPAQPELPELASLDMESIVEQMRRSFAESKRQLDQARLGTDQGAITSCERIFRENSSEVRKAENDLIAWKEKNGLVAPVKDVRTENNRIASAIFNAVSRLVKTVRPQLSGKSDSEQDALWKSKVLECFAALKSSKFADPLPGTSDDLLA